MAHPVLEVTATVEPFENGRGFFVAGGAGAQTKMLPRFRLQFICYDKEYDPGDLHSP